jgi:pilus assembly protein CpaC
MGKIAAFRPYCRRILLLGTLGLAGTCGVAAGAGAGGTAAAKRSELKNDGATLVLSASTGEVLQLPAPATAVFVADPDIADVQVPSPQTVFVLAKKAGSTTLFVLGANGKTIFKKTILVNGPDTVSQLQRVLKARYPALDLTLAEGPGSLMVTGRVSSAAEADSVVQTLTASLPEKSKLINNMTLTRPIQVNLRVRITEVDRNITQQLGINWNTVASSGNFQTGIISGRQFYTPPTATTPTLLTLSPTSAYSIFGNFLVGNTQIQGLLDALDQEGLITTLAEPNLTTLSGETASFLAGGEIPVPVPSSASNSIGIEFKAYGVSLDFTPTVLADNRISLKVRPQVSELDYSNAITINGSKVPAFTVRRLDTTVDLASGQSFALGGLLQSNTSDALSMLPGLGQLPILGKLFSSKNYQNNKTELVVIVTPYLVQPTDPGRLQQPIDSVTRPSNDIEFVLQQQLGLDPLSGSSPRLLGAAGFVY